MVTNSDTAMTAVPDPVLAASLRGGFTSPVTGGFAVTRLPAHALAQAAFDPWVGIAAMQASGTRLEFVSDATRLQLRLRFTLFQFEWDDAPTPASVVVSTDDGHETAYRFDVGDIRTYVPGHIDASTSGEPEDVSIVLPPTNRPRRITVWLPHMAGVQILGAQANGPVTAAPRSQGRWIHYGSSISHGNGAPAAHQTWPVVVARDLGLDLTNLGLAGQAHADQFVARTIRDMPADVISLKLGINIVGAASMRRRVFESAVHGFLDTVRDGHPHTPLLLASPIYCGAHEQSSGPTEYIDGIAREIERSDALGDEDLTLERVRMTLADVVQSRRPSDPQLFYVDGLTLLSREDADLLPDGLHPNALGFERIAERFSAALTERGIVA